jgi:alkylated DNA repair dioxygenase AlkB
MEIQPDLFVEEAGAHENYLGILGLTYVPRFLDAAAQGQCLRNVDSSPWRTDLKRRVQHYGYKYDYKSKSIDRSMYVGELPEFATHIALRLFHEGLMPEIADQMIVNEYERGQGIAAHVDCVPCFGDSIVTISLGSVYDMEFTSLKTGESQATPLELGSALVLRQEARYAWTHQIRPRMFDNGRRRERRVSLTFRKVIFA